MPPPPLTRPDVSVWASFPPSTLTSAMILFFDRAPNCLPGPFQGRGNPGGYLSIATGHRQKLFPLAMKNLTVQGPLRVTGVSPTAILVSPPSGQLPVVTAGNQAISPPPPPPLSCALFRVRLSSLLRCSLFLGLLCLHIESITFVGFNPPWGNWPVPGWGTLTPLLTVTPSP